MPENVVAWTVRSVRPAGRGFRGRLDVLIACLPYWTLQRESKVPSGGTVRWTVPVGRKPIRSIRSRRSRSGCAIGSGTIFPTERGRRWESIRKRGRLWFGESIRGHRLAKRREGIEIAAFLRTGRLRDVHQQGAGRVIHGRVSHDDLPMITLSIAGRCCTAIIDTGFNGESGARTS